MLGNGYCMAPAKVMLPGFQTAQEVCSQYQSRFFCFPILHPAGHLVSMVVAVVAMVALMIVVAFMWSTMVLVGAVAGDQLPSVPVQGRDHRQRHQGTY